MIILNLHRDKSESRPYCAPRVVLVGFHKCGTSDRTKWFRNSEFSPKTADFFINELGNMCPTEFMETKQQMFVK